MTDQDDARQRHEGMGTLLTHKGREPFDHFGFVNTPVFRGSTVLFKTLADIDAQSQRYLYGRAGNPTSDEVCEVVTALESAHRTVLAPSGLAAVTLALLSCLSAGDDVLITDSVYEPTRAFADGFLKRMGISARYYDPRIGAGLVGLMRDNTRAVFTESPGSVTFELQDLPAIAEAAHAHGARVIVDNSWATPLYYKPLSLGADIVVHAATKMFVGHSDAFAGTVSANQAAWPDLAATRKLLGVFTSGDDAYLVARGLKTLHIRMAEHQRRALEIATWIEKQPGVRRVLHPGLVSSPDHDLFRRDFTGSGSLFGVVLEPASRSALAEFLDHMRLFSMGFSWGGYESLCIPHDPRRMRTATAWTETGNLIRLHIGFEDVEDLKEDLSDALARYLNASAA